ncbi:MULTISPECIES: phiSA1p31-related protein [unclassified Streptomyces]|uniref:phiSA1p31-related protein n=1 Tax=unclassified Streptomyces TaxID=2593676 RepID=UPI000371F6B0|nr:MULTISPECIES: phiSA1p31-related protein [unclassified Streptomyces]MYY03088.1 hypothetical protein [Streptomyces sp. SID4913]
MTEFEVDDKVRVLAGGEGIVTYGPVNSAFSSYKLYVVKQDGDDERAFKASDLEPLPAKFAVGDTVTLTTRKRGARATVEYGPFDDGGVYVVKLVDKPSDDNPQTFTVLDRWMEKVPALVPVGTRVRVDRAKYAEYRHGQVGTVTYNVGTFRAPDDAHVYIVDFEDGSRIYAAEVTPVKDAPADTFEYEGVTYEYGVTYIDRDGDPWTFERSRGSDQPISDSGSWSQGESIAYVVGNFGPLEK